MSPRSQAVTPPNAEPTPESFPATETAIEHRAALLRQYSDGALASLSTSFAHKNAPFSSEDKELVQSILASELRDAQGQIDSLITKYTTLVASLEEKNTAFKYKNGVFNRHRDALEQQQADFELQQQQFETERTAFQAMQWEAAKLQGEAERKEASLETKEQSLDELEKALLEAAREHFKKEEALEKREAAVQKRLEDIREALGRLTQQKATSERLNRLTLANRIQQYMGNATAEDVAIMLNWTLSQPPVKNQPKATLDVVYRQIIQPHLLSNELGSSEALRDSLIEPMMAQVREQESSACGTPSQG